MLVDARLRELGLILPAPPQPNGVYVPFVEVGNLLFVSGQTPKRDAKAHPVGCVDAEINEGDAAAAARQAALQTLAIVRSAAGSLDRVERVVRVNGYVRSAPGFQRQSAVVDGASRLFIDVFGEMCGSHARTSVGVAELPGGAVVEIDAIFAVRPVVTTA
jgi:enamine deaminase RidA (YjgF/YER057c/UK114 family)